MNSEKQNALLRVLNNQSVPVSLSILLQQLGADFPERTVRRWLEQFVRAGMVIKVGEKRSTAYVSIKSSIFTAHSQRILEQIKKPYFQRQPAAYNTAWVHAYKPNVDRYLPQGTWALLRSMHAGQSSSKDPAGTYARRIYNRLLIDLSYNSSRLEGNTYSLIETEKLIIEGVANTDKLDEEKVMILNHKEAIRHLVDNAHRLQINNDEICTLHYLLADGLLQPSSSVGIVRDDAVRVYGTTYMPLEGRSRLVDELGYICETASKITDPYEQSFFLLVHIAYLQAFKDVNKRTARLSANIPLIKNNLVPLSFNYINKEDYISAMIAIYELNEVGPLANIFASSYQKTSEEYAVTVEVMGFDEVRVRYRTQRRQVIRDIILQKLTGDALETYVELQTKKHIPEKDQMNFKEDLIDDLVELAPPRIAGLGVTVEELQQWLKVCRK
ncbi:MAG: Fic family protein [Gammaproteobacteria bacterium]|nr:Fic family protein [Gammaproteobacteria bacterium]